MDRGDHGVADESPLDLAEGGLGGYGVAFDDDLVAVGRLADVEACSVCSMSPPQDFSSMSITYHSAMDCLTRRVRIGVARFRAGFPLALGSDSGFDALVRGCC